LRPQVNAAATLELPGAHGDKIENRSNSQGKRNDRRSSEELNWPDERDVSDNDEPAER
jgi:hypothetical protein